MIHCSPNPECMFKAVVWAELIGDLPSVRSRDEQIDLFSMAEGHDADHVELKPLLDSLATKLRSKLDWVHGYRGRRLFIMALFNLRHSAVDRFDVIFSAFAEALRIGPDSCIYGRGPASKLFRHRSRDVGSEIHRMLGLVRFYESQTGILTARPKLFHDTGDMILRKFQARYPGKTLAFALPDVVLLCQGGRVCRIPPADFFAGTLTLEDDFSAMWHTYYQSQYIPARKNIRQAARFIPKKYWDWLEEGKILQKESQK